MSPPRFLRELVRANEMIRLEIQDSLGFLPPPPPAINHSKRLGTGRILRDSNHQNGFNRINAYQSGAQGRHGALPDIGFRVANGREDDVEECLHLLEEERWHGQRQLAQHQHLKSFNY